MSRVRPTREASLPSENRPSDPTFRIAFLFHANLDLLSETLPRCLEALTNNTRESFEVLLHCDGTHQR